jgi:hypothetical protein
MEQQIEEERHEEREYEDRENQFDVTEQEPSDLINVPQSVIDRMTWSSSTTTDQTTGN